MNPAPARLSFEFFPPKTPEMEAQLWRAVKRLEPLGPRFVSVTYGAGGTTRERTHATVARIRRETRLAPAAHLTCVGASRAEIDGVARAYWLAGIRHIVALRGDPPAGGTYDPHPHGYHRALELVAGLRRIADFEVSVAAYPEMHPEAESAAADLDALKRKIDAGATRAITQFFFEPSTFLRFRDRACAAGIAVPIVPGILPIGNFAQVKRFAALCGASIPAKLAARFEALSEDPASRACAAIETAAALCRDLRAAGIAAFHFYTLNRADLVAAILAEIGLAADCPAEA
jgi:methylenetetrahydrofolate reductase (NADPH)